MIVKEIVVDSASSVSSFLFFSFTHWVAWYIIVETRLVRLLTQLF